MPENDPYKYFRIEARELLEALSQGVLSLEKGTVSRDLIASLLRQAHTLKGAARIVNEALIAELSHAIEDILAPHRPGHTAPSRDEIKQLLHELDKIAAALAELEPAFGARHKTPPHETAPPAPPLEEHFETVRVEIGAMDAFLHDVSRAAVYQTAVKEELSGFDDVLALFTSGAKVGEHRTETNGCLPAAHEVRAQLLGLRQNLAAATDKVERELLMIQQRAADLRLVPASSVFSLLERAARDAAEALGKKVDFHAVGGENHLDGHILRALRDALLHVVRNALAHGIEFPSDRIKAGKSPEGKLELLVERRGDRVIFICKDDGRGIELEQVSQAAINRGVISIDEAQTLDPQAALELLLRGGLTTTRKVTQVSGRGLGLEIVRETVSRLKGEVKAETVFGQGTSITLSVPISLEALTVLEVEVSGSVVALPLDATVRALRVAADDIVRSPHGDSVLFEGQALPFAPLITLLRPGTPRPQPQFWSVFIVKADSRMAAVGVDRLLRKTDVVMRLLPSLAGETTLIAGASLNSAGNPQLVIDSHALVELIMNAPPTVAPAPRRKLPLLVIDDSLTTRMLEQSILERAGYDVDLAISGEEALKKARRRQYAMFIVDIEMPGIDGFEFIDRTRADPQLRDIPAILVSSRSSVEDRQRGEQVGARAYIIKSEFNEGQLLEIIRRLVG